jgi:hypothetical protein
MEGNTYNSVFKKLIEDNDSQSEIIRGDQAFADFLEMGIATYRRHAAEIPHRVVGHVRMTTRTALMDWLAGRLEWSPPKKETIPAKTARRAGGEK